MASKKRAPSESELSLSPRRRRPLRPRQRPESTSASGLPRLARRNDETAVLRGPALSGANLDATAAESPAVKRRRKQKEARKKLEHGLSDAHLKAVLDDISQSEVEVDLSVPRLRAPKPLPPLALSKTKAKEAHGQKRRPKKTKLLSHVGSEESADESGSFVLKAPKKERKKKAKRADDVEIPSKRGAKSAVPNENGGKKVTNAKRKSAKSKQPASALERSGVLFARAPGSLWLELLGITLLAGGALAMLALLSYSPDDPAFHVRTTAPVSNWIGPFGAYLADGMTMMFGLGAFGMPLVLGGMGGVCFRRRFLSPRLRQLFGLLAACAGVVTLLQVLIGRAQILPYPAGGLFGVLIASQLLPVLYPTGTTLVASVVAMVGGLLSLDRSLAETARDVRCAVARVRSRIHDQWMVHVETRRLLDEERDCLLQEVREADEAEQVLHDAELAERKARAQKRAKEKAKQKALLEEESEKAAKDVDTSEIVVVAEAPKPVKDPRWARKEGSVIGIPLVMDTLPETPVELVIPSRTPSTGAAPESHALVVSPASTQAVPVPAPRAKEAPVALSPDGMRIVEREDKETPIDLEADVVAPSKDVQWEYPPVKLLDYDAPEVAKVDSDHMRSQAARLVRVFKDFGIEGKVREVRPGPVVTMYEFVPAPGIKVSRIAALSDDIAMAMEAIHVRIVAPIPGKGAVGIEIPNEVRETVYLKECIADPQFHRSDDKLLMALGKNIEGKPYFANLAKMPHALISGTTGSGKSVSVNAMICSILYRARPDEVKFIMIDPKMLELSIYEGIPHLLLPPIIDTKKAANALRWTVQEMESRYQAMSELGVRDLEGFNAIVDKIHAGTDDQDRKLPTDACGKEYGRIPQIVVIIDEYADLLATAGKDVEAYVMRLAQKARAAGIHVMLATQRPSVDVITGVIKANFPVRMGFRLASTHDSKTIINRPGAEKLLGRGDMLIVPPGTSDVTRVHGAFVSEVELHRVVEFLKAQQQPEYDLSILESPEEEGENFDADEPYDARWDDAINIVARSRRCSTSWLQRQLGVGYNRAARIVERMEREGLVGPQQNAKGDRDINVAPLE